MILDATTEALEAKLAVEVTTNQLVCSTDWVDITATTITPGGTEILTNGTTAVIIMGSPIASTQRKCNGVSIYNADTVAATVTVQRNHGGTFYVLIVTTLQPGEHLDYTDAAGWKVIDAQGNVKQSGAGGAGRFVKTTVLISGTTHKVGPTTTTIFIRGVGGGGGGGGASYAAGNQAYGAGGGAGGYLEKTVTVTPNTTYNYTLGAAGTAGANTGGAGGNGGSSTFVVGATTYTVNGGVGGPGMLTGVTLILAAGGAGATVSTNGDLNDGGAPGGHSERHSGLLGVSGRGAPSKFGSGGVGAIVNGVGSPGKGYGAGGGGGTAVSAAQTGGVGTAGCWVVDEYT
jgi:hypothetical protein